MQPLEIGVCTWSLAMPDLASTLEVIKRDLKLDVIHLGFMTADNQVPASALDIVKASGLEVSALAVGFAGEDYSTIQSIAETGGFAMDDQWPARRDKMFAVADLARQLGVKLVSVHVGFVPHDQKDARYHVMVDRTRTICDGLAERGLTLVMETGQETADGLLTFIDAVGRDNIGINFDPANMILYGVGEPAEALSLLKNHVVHVHMKDGTWSDKPGRQWGQDVVLGTGDADIPRIVQQLKDQGYTGPLAIEREAGDERAADISEAIKLLESLPR